VSDRSRRRGLQVALTTFFGVALLADVIASDKPLMCRHGGTLHLLPCITRPAALAGLNNRLLREPARAGDFSIAPPIPWGPLEQPRLADLHTFAPPSRAHWLGTDDLGRDVAARLVHGTRVAALVGPAAVLGVLAIGLLIGLAAGLSRKLDLVLSRVIEVGMTFPTLFLLLAIQGFSDRSSMWQVAVALALTQWPYMARLVRIEAQRTAALPHVEAARALGVTPLKLALRHVAPLAVAPALAHASFGVAQAVLVESALTFFGLGVPLPTATWGDLLRGAFDAQMPLWLLLPPAVAIALVAALFNGVGDAALARLGRR
jgi:peptide/nickel transport system permease protein